MMLVARALRKPVLASGRRPLSFLGRLFGDEEVSPAAAPSSRPFGSSEYHLALLGYVSQTMHPQHSLAAIIEKDADFLMGHVLIGASQCLSPHALADSVQASTRAATAKAIAARVETSTLEKWHVQALEYLVAGECRNAVAVYETILRHDVTDLLALKCATELYAILGDKSNMLHVVSRVLPQWSATMPGYSHLLAMQAYALSENGDHGAAHSLADRAMSMHEEDAVALHALLHVYEVQGKHQDGASLLLQSADQWETYAVLRTHLQTHFALFLIETGRYDRVLKLLRHDILTCESMSANVLIDATQIYWRLVLAGFPADSIATELMTQWRHVVDSDVPLTPLATLHAHTMLSHASAPDGIRKQLAPPTSGLGDDAWDVAAVAAKLERSVTTFSYPEAGFSAIAQAAFAAVTAYNEHRFGDAVTGLLRVRSQAHVLGGSKVEQELYDMLLIDAATRGGQFDLAHLVLNERINAKPQSAQYWHTFGNVMRGLGDADGVDGARRMSYVLGLGQAGAGAS
ncbi:hypothetical protein SPRG_09766 [Saprolegnia parasitica CBS 223.65]|uniref:Tetratricopeptide repeat protein 38 n=1 Tax=Saprolegnia parasitica (strain CBS 223.65) TaxID=695850 RepID=A0A067CDY6_SAPPC|nr:hypothetical protein SPRG_09766 [Saprolegnia parasitica CBS 223.65]KDO25037.1 hypothetical protein SPRG_09766 [Saprolegnia parasitica CBS 223.65]|eukprot:XP_012204305.1 hypothetical protein SPRG_09766 [Saprolegnia parasitica CBS 223.65]